MLFASVKNCNDFFKTRPPMVIFLVSLVLMMVATFCLTFYVKYTDKIANTDVKQNWASLTEHASNQDLCAGSDDHAAQMELKLQAGDPTSVATWITLNLTDFKRGSAVRGFYDLRRWLPRCANRDETAVLRVDFVVPKGESNGTVCAVLQGPSKYISMPDVSLCEATKAAQNATVTTLYSNPDLCTHSNLAKLLLNTGYELESYLSQEDRNIIYVHLVWCTYILLFCILIVLFYAMFYQYEEPGKNYRLT